uniref:Uncharacterized protein n=1 Tax=Romanomermis culicivorax TaxID=13658 RepID=A0A915HPW3_ROMCU
MKKNEECLRLQRLYSKGDREYVEVIADNLGDYESHTNRATVTPLEKICDGLTVPDVRQYFANPKISTLISSKECRQEEKVESPISDDGHKIETSCCKVEQEEDNQEEDEENREEDEENQEENCDYLASMVLNTPSTLWASWKAPYGAGLGVGSYYHSPLPSPLSRTPLRPISEISEMYGSASEDEAGDVAVTNSNQRKSRPSATDSGNPSSPGCSFEGSSDSMDSKYSSSNYSAASTTSSGGGCPSSSTTTVFDSKFKRHSDPSGDLNRQRSSHTAQDSLG